MFKKILGLSPRVIKTARNEIDMNEAARKGYWPLVKPVTPSKKIKSKYAIYQNEDTGKIVIAGDYRSYPKPGWKIAVDFTSYYPHTFESPFAAYLLPENIKVGEKVYLEDLIEDYVGWCWNQGDAYRLEGCDAIWNGTDFDILYEEKKEPCVIG